jgi:uncharacterized protein
METYLRIVDRWSAAILAALLALTVFLGLQLSTLSSDSNPYLLPETHPARKTILDLQQEFGGTFDAAVVAFHNPKSVFNRETLNAVYELSQSFRRMMLANDSDAAYLRELAAHYGAAAPEFKAGIEQVLEGGLTQNDYLAAEKLRDLSKSLNLSHAERAFLSYLGRRLNPIKDMAGLASTDNILTKGGTLHVTKSLRDKVTSPEQIRNEVIGNEMMLNSVISKDEKVTMVAVELFIKQDDADGQVRAYETIRGLIDDYRKRHPEFRDEVYIAGIPIFFAEQKRLTDSDLGTLLPVVILVVGVILIAFFRKPLGFVLPMLNVLMCAIWTLGVMSLMRVPIDLITSILPVFLITICGADAIHMMNEYYTQKSFGISSKEAVRRALREMLSPIVLTTVTTAAGFLFSTATNISSIQYFGIFMAVGLVSAQIISLLLIPAWLNLMGGKAVARKEGVKPGSNWLGELLAKFFGALIKRRRASLAAFVAFMVGAGVMAANIKVEDAGAEYFMKDNGYRQADEFVNTHIAGTSPGWLRIEAGSAEAMLSIKTLEFIDKLDQFLLSQPNITFTYSLATYIKRMHMAMNDMRPEYNRIPREMEEVTSTDPATGRTVKDSVPGGKLVSQLVLLYENSGGGELNYVLTRDFSKGAVLFTMNSTRASDFKEFLDRLDVWLKANKPSDLKVSAAGTQVIWTGVLQEILNGQLASFLLAFSSICVVLMVWLRSIKQGVLAALPLAATMVTYYGAMALLGIELNIGTALISFIVVGIVDYSVHFLHRISSRLSAGIPLDEALLYAIRHSGMSIAFNVAVFSLGFLALLFSEFKPIVYLGGLVAMALFISGFMSLFLISMLAPYFLAESKKVTVLKAVSEGSA